MLVISRRKNESIVINNDITLTIVEIRGDKVRLGIVCPRDVPIHRQEFLDAIHGGVQPRSPDERPFVQAILEEPDDEGARLIFADWLEERGDPLGEFLRNQCALATDERSGIAERQRVLWAEHGWAWRASLPAALLSGPRRRLGRE